MKKTGWIASLGFAGALAIGFIVAGFSTTAYAMQTCDSCNWQYQQCVAAGGSSASCWTCNNPTCIPPLSLKDKHAAKNTRGALDAKHLRPQSSVQK
ncbi:hypothetical protein [Oleiagrimonas soli]|nr:hypothetical protein [Oleiagrimonas soli]MBB6185029.1 hypothetical protein [Oleiagrimonas soli]